MQVLASDAGDTVAVMRRCSGARGRQRRGPAAAAGLISLALGLFGCSARPDAGVPSARPGPAASTTAQHLPDAPPSDANCRGTIAAHQDIQHPNLGTIRVFLVLRPSNEINAHGCVAAVTDKGRTLPTINVDVAGGALHFANPATDSTGNSFVTYNPGRYDGVLVLVPTSNGFDDIGWNSDMSGTHYVGHLAYYDAELQGPGPDGRYTIRQESNDCTPNCAKGTVTAKTLHWSGHDYVP